MSTIETYHLYTNKESEPMPYYVGAGEPEWDEYLGSPDADFSDEPPASSFKYIDPWVAETTLLQFPKAPGPEPEAPKPIAYHELLTPKPGFFARLFGRTAPATPQPSPEQLMEDYKKRQEAFRAHELWKVSGMAATCRAAGVKRVFGRYDGGGDDSFTHLRSIEMNDGRVIGVDELRQQAQAVNYDELVDTAVSALMGNYGAGEFILRGAVVIDFDACTITDEKNADVVFGDETAWSN